MLNQGWNGIRASACLVLGGVFASPSNAQPCLESMGKYVASDGFQVNYYHEVAISDLNMVVGAFRRAPGGAAYIYRPNGVGGWFDEQIIVPDDTAFHDDFGRSVAIFGNVIVIGAPAANPNGLDSGAVYVYRHNHIEWVLDAKLIISGELAENADFGRSVAIEDDVIVVGAPGDDDFGFDSGAVYVFRYNGAQWDQEAKIVASDAEAIHAFGFDVALSADTILVGSPEFNFAKDGDDNTGSAYIYRHTDGDWIEEDVLLASDGMNWDQFGLGVSILDDVAVVGSNQNDEMGENSGAAYVYRYDGVQWGDEQKLLAADGNSLERFGNDVKLNNETLYVSASHADNEDGAVYAFHYRSSQWVQDLMIQSSSPGSEERFGSSIDAHGDLLGVGAIADSTNGHLAGAVYVADLNLDLCIADLNTDCTLDFFDISMFLSLFVFQEDLRVDFTGDGVLDFFDVSAFLSAYSAGCP